MQTNEFRVRPVTRFQLTHYQRDEGGPQMEVHLLSSSSVQKVSGSLRTVGEFPSVEAAEEVGVALQALVPGSTLETIEGRQAAYPPKALAAAMAVRQQQAGDAMPVKTASLSIQQFGLDHGFSGDELSAIFHEGIATLARERSSPLGEKLLALALPSSTAP